MGDLVSDRLQLRFASMDDQRMVYDMLVDESIYAYMFDEDHPGPTWEEFKAEEVNYFAGQSSSKGNYLLIEYEGNIAGAICYACGYVKKHYCELDIWLERNHLGLGIGAEAIALVRDYVHETYNIDTFIIRPWRKNTKAIKAYMKCGFVEDAFLDMRAYYDDETFETYGEGDYGKDETITLVWKSV